jgi:hypothetical protein
MNESPVNGIKPRFTTRTGTNKKGPCAGSAEAQLGKKLIWPPKLLAYTPSHEAKVVPFRPFDIGEAKPRREGASR